MVPSRANRGQILMSIRWIMASAFVITLTVLILECAYLFYDIQNNDNDISTISVTVNNHYTNNGGGGFIYKVNSDGTSYFTKRQASNATKKPKIKLFNNISIFYNIYLEDASNKKSFDLIDEQFEQIYDNVISFGQRFNMFYKTVGDDAVTALVDKFCKEEQMILYLSCHHLGHHYEGDEVLTLQALYDYCHSNISHTVVYLHDKGSFHPSPENDKVRRFLTSAALSPECLDQSSHFPQCNICSFNFMWVPFHAFPGNMWAAKCNYIRKLLPPNQFQEKMVDVVKQARRYFDFRSELEFQDRPSWLGIERYSQEHWACSHPHVMPCALFHGRVFPSDRDTFPPKNLGMAPSYSISMKLMDYYTLDGQLFRWNKLYGTVPHADSWVWYTYSFGFNKYRYIEENSKEKSWINTMLRKDPEWNMLEDHLSAVVTREEWEEAPLDNADREYANLSIVFVGDISMRNMYLSLVYFLRFRKWLHPTKYPSVISESTYDNITHFFEDSSSLLMPFEQCDCNRMNDNITSIGSFENRYYYDTRNRNLVSYIQKLGLLPAKVKQMDFSGDLESNQGLNLIGNRRKDYNWTELISDYLASESLPVKPKYFVFNAGWWDNNFKSKQIKQEILDVLKENGMVGVYRTTAFNRNHLLPNDESKSLSYENDFCNQIDCIFATTTKLLSESDYFGMFDMKEPIYKELNIELLKIIDSVYN